MGELKLKENDMVVFRFTAHGIPRLGQIKVISSIGPKNQHVKYCVRWESDERHYNVLPHLGDRIRPATEQDMEYFRNEKLRKSRKSLAPSYYNPDDYSPGGGYPAGNTGFTTIPAPPKDEGLDVGANLSQTISKKLRENKNAKSNNTKADDSGG